jgi:hypothetical protein
MVSTEVSWQTERPAKAGFYWFIGTICSDPDGIRSNEYIGPVKIDGLFAKVLGQRDAYLVRTFSGIWYGPVDVPK